MDAERLREALERDESLAALFASGTPREAFYELCRHVYGEALELLAQRREAAALERAIELAERAIAEISAQRRRLNLVDRELACTRGCASCCNLRVEISRLEAERLRPVVERLGLQARVRELAGELGSLSRRERLARRTPCALLDEAGACRAHAERPFVCRAANSLDSNACKVAVENADIDARIPIVPAPLGLMRAAAVGLSLALADAGLSAPHLELHVALAQATGRH